MSDDRTQRLAALDHAHLWHPFTPMRQWRQAEPVIIERSQGDYLYDTAGRAWLDGVSSLWCNVHGHHVPRIDQAINDQLQRVAHSTLLGLSSVPAIELAARLCRIAPAGLGKVFYSDAGATALEVAFKMAVGHWHHTGRPHKSGLIALQGAYHGDTTGSMSVGFSELMHRPFRSMIFPTRMIRSPDVNASAEWAERKGNGGAGGRRIWSQEDQAICAAVRDRALAELDRTLAEHAHSTAALVIEPLVQGAAGMVMQPPGYLAGAAELARRHQVLLIADEVAVGFGRTGKMFACEHEGVAPDILCLAKGITGGYLPLAATLATERIEAAFTGEIHEHRTLYHGHTYTGNPLACAAAMASLDLFEETGLIAQVNRKAALLAQWLGPLRDAEKFSLVADVRQRGLMIGIELREPEGAAPAGADVNGASGGYNPARLAGQRACAAARTRGALIRPIGNVVILMPPLAIEEENLRKLAEIVIDSIAELQTMQ